MTPHLLSFWAKLGAHKWPEQYHPVLCHLIDVGQVARQMWNHVFRRRIRGWVTTRLGLSDENAAGAWLALNAVGEMVVRGVPTSQGSGYEFR